MPGYRLFEYLLVLNPHDELRQKIMRVKQAFAEKFDTPQAFHTKPHITLVKYQGLEMMEDRTVHRLQAIALGITPFKVELRNYGHFPTHTIYINVVSELPVKALVRELKEAQRLMRVTSEKKAHFMTEPHLTVCRKLKPWQYEKAWIELQHRQFTGRFIADSMLLLKRPAVTKGRFQVVRRFDFMNEAVTTRQGSLFG